MVLKARIKLFLCHIFITEEIGLSSHESKQSVKEIINAFGL